jgi:hypothetical protein
MKKIMNINYNMPSSALSKGKLTTIASYEKKIKSAVKEYGLTKQQLSTLIKNEFLKPLKEANRSHGYTIAEFKVKAKELFEDLMATD